MTKTMWAIFITTLRITYMAGTFPYLILYLLIQNSIKKARNKEIIGKNLRKYGVPKELRKELKKSYSDTFSLGKMLKYADISKSSKSKGFTINLKRESE